MSNFSIAFVISILSGSIELLNLAMAFPILSMRNFSKFHSTSPIGLSAFSRYSPKKYVGQMFGLWFLASAIGGVLAGLLGGEALDSGLESITPIFSFMIQYYLVIAVLMLVVAYFLRDRSSS